MSDLNRFINKKPLTIKENPSSLDGFFGSNNTSSVSSIDIDEFKPYIDDVRTDEGYSKLAKQRAINQSTGEQVGRTLGNLPFNIGLGLIENVGYLGELAFDWNKSDYSNAITEFAKENRNLLGEVYQENPDQVFDFNDPAWYLNTLGGLTESIGEFAISGMGIGGALGKGSKALSQLLKTKGLLNIAKGTEIAGALGTSSSLGFLESAAIGSDLYKRILSETGSEEQAAEGAAYAARMNTGLLALTNFTGVMPMFKSARGITKGAKEGLGRVAGEGVEQRLGRINQYIQDLKIRDPKRAAFLLQEGGLEAFEEELNILSERRGEIEGGIREDEDFLTSFTEGVFTEEGLLSGVLGAIGGVGQSGAIKYLPRLGTKPDGSYGWTKSLDEQYRLEELASKKEYANDLATSLNTMIDLNNQLKDAATNNDPQKVREIKHRIFDNLTVKELNRDMLEGIEQQMQEIASIPNDDLSLPLEKEVTELSFQIEQLLSQEKTPEIEQQIAELQEQKKQKKEEAVSLKGKSEATMKGFAESVEDNKYKEIATQKAAKVRDYSAKLKQFEEEYNVTEEAQTVDVAREAVRRYINLDSSQEIFNDYQKDYTDFESSYYKQQIKGQTDVNAKLPLKVKIDGIELALANVELDSKKYKDLKKEQEQLQKELEEVSKTETKEIPKNQLAFVSALSQEYSKLKNAEYELEQAQEQYDEITNRESRQSFISKQVKERVETVKKIKKDQADQAQKDLVNKNKLYDSYKESLDVIDQNDNPEDQVLKQEIEKEFDKPKPNLKELERKVNLLKSNSYELAMNKKQEQQAQKAEEARIKREETSNQKEPPIEGTPIEDLVTSTEEDLASEDVNPNEAYDDEVIPVDQNDEDQGENINLYIEDDVYEEPKIINAAVSLALPSSKNYKEDSEGIETISNSLNPEYPKIMMSGELQVGDELTFEVDKNYNKNGETYQSLLDKDNGQGMHVPIAVYRGKDFLHYIHDITYIRPDRVVESIIAGQSSIDNLKIQKAELRNIREQILKNDGKAKGIITELTGESVVSRLVPDDESKGKNYIDSSQAFKNDSIEFGIVRGNKIVASGSEKEVTNNDEFFEENQGSIVVLLPRSHDKNSRKAHKLKVKTTNYTDTILAVLEDYLTDSTKYVDQFSQLGYNIKDRDAVQELISQYVFLDSALAKDDKVRSNDIFNMPGGRYYLSIVNSRIYIQSSNKKSIKSNPTATKRVEINKENFDQFKPLLESHISKMFTNFDQSKSGSNITLHTVKGGKVNSKTINYNDFIKESTETNIRENRFTYKDEQMFSYFDNPNINFSLDNSKEVEETVEEKVESETNIKEGVSELFESNPELSTIGNKQQYSQYLDTIFPDSKVKDIVYHGTDEIFNNFNLDNFGKSSQVIDETDVKGISVSGDRKGAKFYGKIILPLVVSIKNPTSNIISSDSEGNLIQNWKDFDAVIDSNSVLFGGNKPISNTYEIILKEPEQIHILGSKQDIEGFKEFVNKETKEIKLFNSNDKQLKKGSVVEYNGKKYLFWNNNNGKAQLINTDGTKFSGTPNIDKLTILGSYSTTIYNNTEYIVTDNNNIYSGATGKLVYTGKDNSSKTQKQKIIDSVKSSIEIKKEKKKGILPKNLGATLNPNAKDSQFSPIIFDPSEWRELSMNTHKAIYKQFGFINEYGGRKMHNYKYALKKAQELNTKYKGVYFFKLKNFGTTVMKQIDIYEPINTQEVILKPVTKQLSLFDKMQNVTTENAENNRKLCR